MQSFYVYFSSASNVKSSTHSSVLAWRIPGTEEPGGLPSMGSHRVGHNWRDLAAAAACKYFGEGNGNPLLYSRLENPMNKGAWQATAHGVTNSQTWLNDFTCKYLGFAGGSDGKESACNAGDPGSIPGSGRSPGEENGYPLQYSCLENLMDRGA